MNGIPGDATIDVAGERLVLMPERAVYWPRRATLLVADPHFGKGATFRAGGVPVPGGTTAEGLDRLEQARARTGAHRIVLLGDFLHAREGRATGTLDAIARWRHTHPALEVVLVRGNHDRRAGDPPPEAGVVCTDPPLTDPPFELVHHPAPLDSGYVLAGHLHPGVRLQGAGGQRARLPCFWFGERVGVLPAFGDFTGLALVEPAVRDRVYALAGDAVVLVEAAVR